MGAGRVVHRVAGDAVKPLEAFPRPDRLVDLRSSAAQSHHGYMTRSRPWTSVSGVCLHQTACVLGELAKRWETVGAHYGVTRGGQVMWLHDPNRLVIHGNGWNAKTVGIEIDGLYAGVAERPETVWNDPSTPQREQGQTLTMEAQQAACQLIRWIVSEVAKNGGEVTKLVAHRQSSKDRRDDPGSAIWKGIALPMSAELGLDDGGDGFVIGGLPIPVEWDPSRTRWRY